MRQIHVLQRDAIACPSSCLRGLRAGNHQRHTRLRNASSSTHANNAARATNSDPPNQAAVHASSQDTYWSHQFKSRTPQTYHTASCATKAPGTDRAAQHPPWMQQEPAQSRGNAPFVCPSVVCATSCSTTPISWYPSLVRRASADRTGIKGHCAESVHAYRLTGGKRAINNHAKITATKATEPATI